MIQQRYMPHAHMGVYVDGCQRRRLPKVQRAQRMQITEQQKQELRARLASRTSLLGGVLSTTSASKSSSCLTASQRFSPKDTRDTKRPVVRQGPQPGIPSAPRKATGADYLAFEALARDTAPRSDRETHPTPAPSQPFPRQAAAGKLDRTPLRPSPGQASAGGSAHGRNAHSSQSPGLSRVSLSPFQRNSCTRPQKHRPGKKGQATRQSAVAPQAAGGPTRRQKADLAWALQMEEFRKASGPAQPGHTSANGLQQIATGQLSTPAALPGLNYEGQNCTSPEPRAALRCSSRKLPGKQISSSAQQPAAKNLKSAVRSSQSADAARQGPTSLHKPAAAWLAKKDLSKLPEWQRMILEKKAKEELGLKRQRLESEADGADLDGFVVSDSEADWRAALKSITGYDPSKFSNEPLDDRTMEADWRSIQAEERRSTRLGRKEDTEAELAELAEQKARAARKRSRAAQG